MKEAVNAVKSGMSLGQASRAFFVSKTSLSYHVRGIRSSAPGRPLVFTQNEEQMLVEIALKFADCGMPLTREGIRTIGKNFLNASGKKSRFINNTPSNKWCRGFLRRWPTLSVRIPENLAFNRARAMSREVIGNFFEIYRTAINRAGVANKPHCIWNADESGFGSNPNHSKVICSRGSRNVNLIVGSAQRQNFTVMICVNAVGQRASPVVIYRGKRMKLEWTLNGPQDAAYRVTSHGWMEEPVFFEWLTKFFIPFAKSIDVGGHVLVLDGHNSHCSIRVAEACGANGIELVILPPHSSSALQPLDVGVFGPAKKEWSKILNEYFRSNNFQSVEKLAFPAMLKSVLERAFYGEHVISGFRGSGLYPVDPDRVMQKLPAFASNAASSASSVEEASQNLDSPSTSTAASWKSAVDDFLQGRLKAKQGGQRGKFLGAKSSGQLLTSAEALSELKKQEEKKNKKKEGKKKF